MKAATYTTYLTGFAMAVSQAFALECVSRGDNEYSYCYQIPSGASKCADKSFPTIIWLNGISSFWVKPEMELLADVRRRASIDGIGQIMGAPGSPLYQRLAQDFLVIIPISDDAKSEHYHPDMVNKVIGEVDALPSTQRDKQATFILGHSAGCRGAIRYAIENRENVAALSCSAGGAEKMPFDKVVDENFYGYRLLKDSIAETWGRLINIVTLPVWLHHGTADTLTVKSDCPNGAPVDTAGRLVELGSHVTVPMQPLVGVDHNGMSMAPWTGQGDNILDWLVKNRRGGACNAQKVRKLGRAAMWPGKASLDDLENPM